MTYKPCPIGYCIYCGATNSKLSKEHVVPLSLGGTAIVPEASCGACEVITSKFEGHIARARLGDYRTRTGAPTRRPRERPKSLELELLDADGSSRMIELDPSEHPAALILPDLPEARVLLPALVAERRKFRLAVFLPDEKAVRIAQTHGAHAFRLGSFEIGCWYRQLAKIAHSGAFLTNARWTDDFEPLLPGLILGQEDDFDRLVGGWGGSWNEGSNPGFPILELFIDIEGVEHLTLAFRLFRPMDTPTYLVVVGRRRN